MIDGWLIINITIGIVFSKCIIDGLICLGRVLKK